MNILNNVINMKNERIRTVSVNERGQIVIPEDIRKDLGIGKQATLVLIERSGELVLKKEEDVLAALDEEKFWKAVSYEAVKNAWSKEDSIWDEIAKKEGIS